MPGIGKQGANSVEELLSSPRSSVGVFLAISPYAKCNDLTSQ